MIKKIDSGSKGFFSFTRGSIDLALLVAFTILLIALFASRISLFGDQPRWSAYDQSPSNSLDTGQSSIESWNIYEDAEFGYSLEYPAAWVLRDLTDQHRRQDELRVVVFGPPIATGDQSGNMTDVPEYNARASVTVSSQILDAVVEKAMAYGLNNAKKSPWVLDSIDAVRIDGDALAWDYIAKKSVSERTVMIVVPREHGVLIFSFNLQTPSNTQNKMGESATINTVVDRMLSSVDLR